MRYVLLKDAKPGMLLAGNLEDTFGRKLISDGVTLSEEYIEKLKDLGFPGIYIHDDISVDIHLQDIISPTLRAEGLHCIKKRDVEGCREVSKRIVASILPKKAIELDLMDLRSYDDYTYAHSVNVAVFSCVIGKGMGMSEEEQINLVMAGLLHDIGKLAVPKEIMYKPGRLTPEEYLVVQGHAQMSYEFIKNRVDIPAIVKDSILSHHENVDGSGYPNGTDASKQTIYTKILHVADVYDALTSKRPYLEPYAPYEAAEYMMGACGILFDKEVVDAFLRYIPFFPRGSQVKLSDGKEGVILENEGIHNLRPMVRLMDGRIVDLTRREYLHLTVMVSGMMDGDRMEDAELQRKYMLNKISPYQIVVVDDMFTNLQMLREMLEHTYKMVLLKSGEQALEYLRKHGQPDLIIMDIDMPKMDGIETTQKIHEEFGYQTPVLFVTALCDRETVLKCRDQKAAGYIVRPYNPVFIKSEIRRILTGRSEIE